MRTRTLREWISGAELDRILGISWKARARVAAAGGIQTRTLPGMPPRYSRADVERVAAESIKPAAADMAVSA